MQKTPDTSELKIVVVDLDPTGPYADQLGGSVETDKIHAKIVEQFKKITGSRRCTCNESYIIFIDKRTIP